MKKKNIALINSISSVCVQLAMIISGFIIPRIILKSFNSEVNGLVSSLTQFLNYISLLEGGVTGVVMAALYKPLYDKDNEKISSIVYTAKKFYTKISLVFILYTLLLAVLYPIIFNTKFSFAYISTLTLVLSLKLFIQYMFSLSFKTLLNADRKVYFVSITQIILIAFDVILFVLLVDVYKNIHFLKFVSGIIYIIQPILFNRYIKKHYCLDKNAPVDNKLIKNRWDGFAINVAAFIHFNTDITILSIFKNLMVVSVYSVYALVSSGLRKIVKSVSSALEPSMGRLISKGDQFELNEKFDRIEYAYFVLVFLFFSIGIVCITPFVTIYTKGITDINYKQPLFGVLLLIAEGLYTLRSPYVSIAYSANKFKDIKKYAYMEAILNVLISVILVIKLGLIGVAIGTLVSITSRGIFQIAYLKNNILNRPIKKFIKKFIIFLSAAIVGYFISYELTIGLFAKNTISTWILGAMITSFIYGMIYLIISLIFFKKDIVYFKKYLMKKNK